MLPEGQQLPAELEGMGLTAEDLTNLGDEPDAGGELSEDGGLEASIAQGTGQAATPPAQPSGAPAPASTPAAPAPSGEHPSAAPPAPAGPAATPSAPASANAPGQPAAAAPAPQPGQQAAPQAQPWTFTADGRQIQVPESTVNADGSVTLSAKGIKWLGHHALADRRAWQQERGHYAQQLQAAQTAQSQREGTANAVLDKLMAAAKEGPDKLYEVCASFLEDLGRIEQEAAARVRDQENATLRQQAEETRRERDWLQYEPTFQQGFAAEIDAMLQHPDLEVLVPHRAELLNDLWAMYGRATVMVADRDIPGIAAKGGYYLDLRPVTQELARQARIASRFAAKRQQAEADEATRAAAAARNSAALGTTQVPPAVPMRGAPTETTGTKKAPTNRDEWREHMRAVAVSPDL